MKKSMSVRVAALSVWVAFQSPLAPASGTPSPAPALTGQANAGAAKAEPPKRIKLVVGAAPASEPVSLKGGESRRYVVRGRIGQIFMVDADSKALEIKMVKGKDAAPMAEPGHYDSTLVANGDYVFQVRNTSNSAVNATLSVLISDTGASKR